ncbi:Flp1 family type IVb pilin [Paenibacillus senegalensis]|uniref:Flp1 family type IVb pilin n=1 Tax=Paenibacillus senegalensis TaxID=1465766 RepID=UPI000287A3E6|nr:Flp1 family type IVb pilin [Paenibacillus senegalensis]
MGITLIEAAKKFWNDEDGIGTLEILLILAVIVIIAIAFRKWIIQWVSGLFKAADDQIKDQTNPDLEGLMPE